MLCGCEQCCAFFEAGLQRSERLLERFEEPFQFIGLNMYILLSHEIL